MNITERFIRRIEDDFWFNARKVMTELNNSRKLSH